MRTEKSTQAVQLLPMTLIRHRSIKAAKQSWEIVMFDNDNDIYAFAACR